MTNNYLELIIEIVSFVLFTIHLILSITTYRQGPTFKSANIMFGSTSCMCAMFEFLSVVFNSMVCLVFAFLFLFGALNNAALAISIGEERKRNDNKK